MKTQIRLTALLLLALGLSFSACKSKAPEKGQDEHGHAHDEKGEEGHEHGKEEKGHDDHSEGDGHGHGVEKKSEGHGEEGEHGEEVKLTEDQIKMMNIKVVKAEKRNLGIVVEALGDIASDTDRVVQIRPEEPGTLKELLVAVGDSVSDGQVLLRYAPDGRGSDAKELKASNKGVVVGLYGDVGGHIDPAVPLATLADTSKLRAGLDLYEKDLGRVKKGQTVDIIVSAYPKDVFTGRITYISPRVDENTRTVKIRVDVDNPRGLLKFGMFITGRIRVAERWVQAVPEISLQEVEGKTSVFTVEEDGAFKPHPVQLGERAGGYVEIVSGIEPDERVVSQGSFVLKAELAKGEAAHEH